MVLHFFQLHAQNGAWRLDFASELVKGNDAKYCKINLTITRMVDVTLSPHD